MVSNPQAVSDALHNYKNTNRNTSSVKIMEPGALNSWTILEGTSNAYVYTKVNAIFHELAVLLSSEGFWLRR
jgi:hypothetical protein